MSATIRENLLVTMALYAGEMVEKGIISLPFGNEGEDVFADFCAECVDRWMAPDGLVDENGDRPDIAFCTYAQQALMELFCTVAIPERTEDAKRYKVVAYAGTVERDMGIEGTYEECEQWCDAYDWVYCPDGPGSFEWDLEVEEL